ncbi:MAG TPA: FHA domain-containing protein [Steroidobacteraceae bacterium]|nr:FHA domain-containing protein [Steroidobacteraceae bacterium]
MASSEYFLKKVSTGAQIPLVTLVTVGRSEDSGLRLVEGQPSRHHAQIIVEQSSVFVEDLGSTNGTFVNGQRLAARHRTTLSGGDRVRFDIEEFEFVAPLRQPAADSDKTVFRPADADKTVFRPAGPAAAAATPAAAPGQTLIEPRARAASDPPAASRPRAESGPSAAKAVSAPPPPSAERPSAGPAARSSLPGSFVDPKGTETVLFKGKAAGRHADGGSLEPVALGTNPCLIITSGDEIGRRFDLAAGAESAKSWRIGSDESNEIRLVAEGVSGRHATLRFDAGKWRLTDDLSKNGTFINDVPTLGGFLGDRDRLRFGPVECVFRLPSTTVEAQSTHTRWRRYAVIAAIACALTLALLFALLRLSK